MSSHKRSPAQKAAWERGQLLFRIRGARGLLITTFGNLPADLRKDHKQDFDTMIAVLEKIDKEL